MSDNRRMQELAGILNESQLDEAKGEFKKAAATAQKSLNTINAQLGNLDNVYDVMVDNNLSTPKHRGAWAEKVDQIERLIRDLSGFLTTVKE